MKIDIITIFPEFFREVLNVGIVRRAQHSGIAEIEVHHLREYSTDKHLKVDDRPFGGGDGMVLNAQPIFDAIENIVGTCERDKYPAGTRVVLLSPQGKPLKQATAKEFSEKAKRIIMICGRYEGIDERVNEALVTHEVSIGDYVLSGGEPAALVLTDAIVRLLPKALGSDTSAENDSFSNGLLDCPHYTRPADFRGMKVPAVLVSGDHEGVAKWRRERALEKTKKVRKDLLK